MSQKKHQASPDPTGQPEGNNEPLPPLSPKDFRTYNRMAEQMDQFHNHFRLTWNQLQDACTSTGKKSSGLSPRQLIMAGLNFCSQLDFHHSIEEQHIFPVLAKRMPEFRRELELLSQHRQIHKGLEKLEDYLTKCRSGEVDLQREEVKRLMDGFGDVLWRHLDEEVRTLGAENMRRCQGMWMFWLALSCKERLLQNLPLERYLSQAPRRHPVTRANFKLAKVEYHRPGRPPVLAWVKSSLVRRFRSAMRYASYIPQPGMPDTGSAGQ
ncbi:hypothetical protein CNMCM8980_006472 [Aspergillus fumigatiaffinis]|uniref:Hemerythrin-like domain-containing protein n=1 Tax=Aspergillus fumigatiaffinis TaxID=340414 RepID=A0A8H4GVG4_9EURO|nr:hypothetical protein CNMCM5878_007010 [Aspergillus fumigatiaffinis]KAF4229058.1 hypothetical protein CNMCM6457_006649 [Aspergillus fumigatiaffinis]KAF4236919.1 hypothetical protein CNMCM6805_007141 [Aspergillus fumigatiaffinis]KAF4248008.1 hypothetical protein CNMCM8980_006472 [Aspergillus fumigatiaffinis]